MIAFIIGIVVGALAMLAVLGGYLVIALAKVGDDQP